jgi:hypothetical protein
LTHEQADRHASPTLLAQSFFRFAYRVGVKNLPPGTNARAYVRQQLDRLGGGDDLTHFPWGRKRVNLPPSIRAP